jgi:hypothetical protein
MPDVVFIDLCPACSACGNGILSAARSVSVVECRRCGRVCGVCGGFLDSVEGSEAKMELSQVGVD